MSTSNTALGALFLCLAAGGASGNAVRVLTSHVGYDFEVPCALDLIPPLFRRFDNDSASYAPRLFVIGNANWLNGFLRRFPSVATIFFGDFLLAAMMPSASIVLHIVGGITGLAVPARVRLISWLSSSTYNVDSEIDPPLVPDTCHTNMRVMVTTRPRGTTHVFSVPMPCSVEGGPSEVKSQLFGVWSPDAGWSAPHVALFPPLCASWRPPPNRGPPHAQMFLYGSIDDYHKIYFLSSKAFKVLQLLTLSYGSELKVTANTTTKGMTPFMAADTCRLDVLAFPSTPHFLNVLTHTELSVFPWELDSTICLVPLGAGKPRSVLYPITAEYTPAVWAALAAIVLAVVACMYLMGRDENVQELVLQTLSPLLGQPLDEGPGGPQIAVLGGWLMTCVVVVAGYQGQLLGFITVPPQNREINSWQDWLESDLVLIAHNRFALSDSIASGLYGLTEERIVRASFRNVIEVIATQRNCSACVSIHDYHELINGHRWTVLEDIQQKISKIHTFTLPKSQNHKATFFTTKGSPFEIPLRKILGRIQAAGLFRYNQNLNKFLWQATEDKPISILNLTPVFALYITGNILAMFIFLLEFLFAKSKKMLLNLRDKQQHKNTQTVIVPKKLYDRIL
ncbi:Ionotropic receptor 254 [Frankliniella occidentalis]|nr:Ionotropic receptor 254 [Frankliniella occidentalis]